MSFRSSVKKVIPRQAFKKIEPYGHLTEAVLEQTIMGFPARGLKVIGVTGTDGKKQVVYAGHPLYYYAADTKAGETNGQGIDGFGAKWWLLQPSGQPITSAPANPSTGSGGGYGYP